MLGESDHVTRFSLHFVIAISCHDRCYNHVMWYDANQADWHASAWSQLSCQHADSVLLVANAADLPEISEVRQ